MFAVHSNVDVVNGDDWREIDRELREIAKRQRALDAEEAALLCVVSRRQIWRELGCATMLEYLELIFGYGPKVGYERVRVALAIDELPELREALATGDVSYSALRELTRVTTPSTQREWLDAVRGKSVREIEDLVRTHRKGDLPTDPGDPDLKPRRLTFEVSTATSALLREARQSLATERGRFVEDDELVAAMAAAVLEGGVGDGDPGRAKYQIRVTTCVSCSQTSFEGGGRKIAVDGANAARADCDAQRIGADQRAVQDVAPKTRRDVMHRDGGKCAVPRCRSARFLEVHHIVPRSEGGSHDASNLLCLCDAHHLALHEHKLEISGSAPNITVRFANELVDPKPAAPRVSAPESRRLIDAETPAKATHAETRHLDPKRLSLPGSKRAPTKAAHVEPRDVESASPHVETLATVQFETRHVESKPAASPHVETPAKATNVQPSEIPHIGTPPKATRHVESRPRQLRHAESQRSVEIRHAETPEKTTHVGTRHVESKPAATPDVETSPNAYARAVLRAEAKQALRQLGFSPAIAIRCVDAAVADRPPTTLEQLIRDALKYSR